MYITLTLQYLRSNIKQNWAEENLYIVPRIIDSESMNQQQHSECVLIGLTYKEMSLRSSVSIYFLFFLNHL